MRFRSVRVQRLPFFDQVIAIFKKTIETIDVFRFFFPVSDVLERARECFLSSLSTRRNFTRRRLA